MNPRRITIWRCYMLVSKMRRVLRRRCGSSRSSKRRVSRPIVGLWCCRRPRLPDRRMQYQRKLSLLVLLALLAINSLAQKPSRSTARGQVMFEEVSPQASKLNWTHNNARSPDRQLPETVGAGCAFLDYDNDGWLDIYLVNSGPSDFFTPATP